MNKVFLEVLKRHGLVGKLDVSESLATGMIEPFGTIKTKGLFGTGFLGRNVGRLEPAPEMGVDVFMIFKNVKYYCKMKEVIAEYDGITGNKTKFDGGELYYG